MLVASLLSSFVLAAPHAVIEAGAPMRAGTGARAPAVKLDTARLVEVVRTEGDTIVVRATTERGCVAPLPSRPGIEWRVDAAHLLQVLPTPLTVEGPAGALTLGVGTPMRLEDDGDVLVSVDQGLEVRLSGEVARGAVRLVTYTPEPPAPRGTEPWIGLAPGEVLALPDVRVTVPKDTNVRGTPTGFARSCVTMKVAAPAALAPEKSAEAGGVFGGVLGGMASSQVFVPAGTPVTWEHGGAAGVIPAAGTVSVASAEAWCFAPMDLGPDTPKACVAKAPGVVWLGQARFLSESEVGVRRRPLALPDGVSCTLVVLVSPGGTVLNRDGATCSRDGQKLAPEAVDAAWFVGLDKWYVQAPATLPPTGARVRIAVSDAD